MTFSFIYENPRDPPGMTWAEPGEGLGTAGIIKKALSTSPVALGLDLATNRQAYIDMFRHAERSERLTGNIASEQAAQEEAYDRAIAAAKSLTGVELENPIRGGYAREAKDMVRDAARGGAMGGEAEFDAVHRFPQFQRRIFEQRLDDLRRAHPDKGPDLTFDLDADARQIARGAAKETAPEVDSLLGGFGTQMAGGMWGQRRDPLFVGTMFAGPTTAAGKTAFARVVSAALRQGFFNAGARAVEQPAVQDWRARIGLESGVLPALEDVGMAWVTGAILGGAFRGLHEASPVKRLLEGRPEKGDFDAAARVTEAPVAPEDRAVVRAGEEHLAADRAVLTEPPPKSVSRESHDDLTAAALRRADDPTAPGPDVVLLTQQPTVTEPRPAVRFSSEQPRERGFEVRWNEKKSQFEAVLPDGKVIGHLLDAFPPGGDKPAFTASVEVDPAWRRRGVASALYDQFAAKHEGNITPAGNTTPEAWSFWLARYPEKVNEVLQSVAREVAEDISKNGFPASYAKEVASGYSHSKVREMFQKAVDEALLVPRHPEIEARIAEAQPRTLREAQEAADWALDDAGRQAGMARTSEALSQPVHEPVREPVRGYHGSAVPFEQLKDTGPYFFSPHQDVAANYAMATEAQSLAIRRGEKVDLSGNRPHVVEADLTMNNPFKARWNDYENAARARDSAWLRKNGYDSAIIHDPADPKATEFVVLDKSQINPAAATKGRPRSDIIDKIPTVRDDGSAITVAAAALRKAGEKEEKWAMLVRSCK